MSALKDVWSALRAIIGIADNVQALSAELRDLRRENQEIRERLVRLETIIEEARAARRQRLHSVTMQQSLPKAKD